MSPARCDGRWWSRVSLQDRQSFAFVLPFPNFLTPSARGFDICFRADKALGIDLGATCGRRDSGAWRDGRRVDNVGPVLVLYPAEFTLSQVGHLVRGQHDFYTAFFGRLAPHLPRFQVILETSLYGGFGVLQRNESA